MTPTQPPQTHTHTLPQIWGDVKKTSPMKGEVFFTGDISHTYIHTRGHRDSMTESAQWADSVKMHKKALLLPEGQTNSWPKAEAIFMLF